MSMEGFHGFNFNIGDRVHIDEDKSIKGRVIGILVREGGVEYDVAWFNNGAQVTAWIASFRLSEAE